MQCSTSRFGLIEVRDQDVVRFPAGLVGLEDCQDWALLADQRSGSIAWLQSLERPDVALPVTSPRRFVPSYQVRVARRELTPLDLNEADTAEVLVVVGGAKGELTLNLKAPLVVNVRRGLGRQVITRGDLPVRFSLEASPSAVRRIA